MPHHTLPLFTLQPETKEIPLTKGKFAIVNESDYDRLMEWTWSAWKSDGKWYARRCALTPDGRLTLKFMHCEIMGATGIDHVDGDGLNNTRFNLRVATESENQRNRGPQVNNKSGYKGVSWTKRLNKWVAQINFNGKHKHLGLYTDVISAARAYDRAALKYHGEFAWLNFDESGHDDSSVGQEGEDLERFARVIGA